MKEFLKYFGIILTSFIILAAGVAVSKKIKPNTIVLETNNTVVLSGEITTESAGKVAADILTTQANPVYLYIKSPGGSVMDGMRLASVIQNADKEVICIGDIAISMAFGIMQACDTRLVTNNSVMMQHVASFGLEVTPAPNATTFIKFMSDMVYALQVMQADRIGMGIKEFIDITRDDWWLLGNQAVAANVADKVVNVTCGPMILKAERKETHTSMFGKVDVIWYACPLIDIPKSVGYPGNSREDEKDKFEDSLDLRKQVETMVKKR